MFPRDIKVKEAAATDITALAFGRSRADVALKALGEEKLSPDQIQRLLELATKYGEGKLVCETSTTKADQNTGEPAPTDLQTNRRPTREERRIQIAEAVARREAAQVRLREAVAELQATPVHKPNIEPIFSPRPTGPAKPEEAKKPDDVEPHGLELTREIYSVPIVRKPPEIDRGR